MNQPKIDLSPKVSDEIRKTTCYMCACRCGINVHMKKDPWVIESGLYRGQPRPPCEQRGSVRQRLRWHHAGQCPIATARPSEAGWPTRFR